MKKKIILFALFLFISPSLYGLEKVNDNIRIGILVNVKNFNISSKSGFSIIDSQNKKIKYSKNVSVPMLFSAGKLSDRKNSMTFPVKIESEGDIAINGKNYHGYFLIIKNRNGKGVNVINILDIEDYIKGVVPKESLPGWPIEALKVQSVISRTYAIANLGKHSLDGFDLCDGTHCQVYGGADAQTPVSDEAVKLTKGEVLTHEGKLANTFFFSNSGGITEEAKYVWGGNESPKYLKSVKDPYSKGQPNYSWESEISESFIRNKLKVGKISSIQMRGKTPSGSVKNFLIKHSKGNKTIGAAQFRLIIDPNRIKSTLITSVKKSGGSFIFKGNGWGHRVGLSQWGAKAMSDKGMKYTRILKFYYPGTKIEKVKYK
ncbi:MAG: SpoIID/LytB domain-containing protein [Elusimicrobiota bacterium]|nr:SpoIID/LytB domain-containing protein [Elusimicrobiota bacterium]